MKSIKKVKWCISKKEETLDVLINNAVDFDLSIKSPVVTKDGLEKKLATTLFLFAFYLVEGLVGKVWRVVGLLIFLPKG